MAKPEVLIIGGGRSVGRTWIAKALKEIRQIETAKESMDDMVWQTTTIDFPTIVITDINDVDALSKQIKALNKRIRYSKCYMESSILKQELSDKKKELKRLKRNRKGE